MATTKKETPAEKKARLAAEKLAEENQALEQRLADAERIRAQEAEDMAAQLEAAQRQIAELQTPQVPEVEIIAPAVQHDIAEQVQKEVGKQSDKIIDVLEGKITEIVKKHVPEQVQTDVKTIVGYPKWVRWALLGLAAAVLFALVLPYFQNKAIEKRLEKVQQMEKRDSVLSEQIEWMDVKQQQTNKLILSIEGRYDTAAIERAKKQVWAFQQIENNKKQKDALKTFVANPSATNQQKLDLFTKLANGTDDSNTSQDR